MSAQIKVANNKQTMITKEGFETIRRRAFDSNNFLNISLLNGKKLIINKTAIEWIGDEEKLKDENEE